MMNTRRDYVASFRAVASPKRVVLMSAALDADERFVSVATLVTSDSGNVTV